MINVHVSHPRIKGWVVWPNKGSVCHQTLMALPTRASNSSTCKLMVQPQRAEISHYPQRGEAVIFATKNIARVAWCFFIISHLLFFVCFFWDLQFYLNIKKNPNNTFLNVSLSIQNNRRLQYWSAGLSLLVPNTHQVWAKHIRLVNQLLQWRIKQFMSHSYMVKVSHVFLSCLCKNSVNLCWCGTMSSEEENRFRHTSSRRIGPRTEACGVPWWTLLYEDGTSCTWALLSNINMVWYSLLLSLQSQRL